MRTIQIIFICCITIISVPTALSAQELLASININHSKIQGTNTNVFSDLETNITEFMNDRKWTGQQ